MPFKFSGFFNKYLGYSIVLLFAACSVPPELLKQESTLIGVVSNDTTKVDASINQLIEPYKQDLDKEMSEVLIISEAAFEKAQPEGALGNLVADIVFEKGNERYKPSDLKYADFCLLNNGGLRVSLPQGEITKGKIFELMPFENEIVVLTLSGEKVSELIQYIIGVGGQPVSGVQIKSMNQPNPIVLLKGMPFDKTKTYKVVTSDYLANGGDKMNFFIDPIMIETTGYKIRDAIIDYLTSENAKGNSLKPHPRRRITNEQ